MRLFCSLTAVLMNNRHCSPSDTTTICAVECYKTIDMRIILHRISILTRYRETYRITIAQRHGTISQKEEGEKTVSTFRDDPFK